MIHHPLSKTLHSKQVSCKCLHSKGIAKEREERQKQIRKSIHPPSLFFSPVKSFTFSSMPEAIIMILSTLLLCTAGEARSHGHQNGFSKFCHTCNFMLWNILISLKHNIWLFRSLDFLQDTSKSIKSDKKAKMPLTLQQYCNSIESVLCNTRTNKSIAKWSMLTEISFVGDSASEWKIMI